MNKHILLAALCTCGMMYAAHNIQPENITPSSVKQCIDTRIANGNETTEDIITSIQAQLDELQDQIDESIYQQCLEVLATYKQQ